MRDRKRKRLKKIEGGFLDLHGVKHADVSREVDNFINDYYNFIKQEPELRIITGHSVRMQEIVTNTLLDYGLEVNVRDADILVK